MRTLRAFLVIRAGGEMRIVKLRPNLALNEVAFPVVVSIPDAWGRVQTGAIEIAMPEPSQAALAIGEPIEPA